MNVNAWWSVMTTSSTMILVVLLLLAPRDASALNAKPSPAVVRLERAARELAATFIFEGLVQAREPLELFDDPRHQEFWFDGTRGTLEADLATAATDKTYETIRPVPPPPDSAQESASPLLAARARRAQPKRRFVTAAPLQTAAPVPEGAEPLGPAESAADSRSRASKALVRHKLTELRACRHELDSAVNELLDPLVAPDLAAFDLAVLLLFLSEIQSGLPVPVAAKEAGLLTEAYSGDAQQEQHGVRHVQGVLGAYARERLGRAV